MVQSPHTVLLKLLTQTWRYFDLEIRGREDTLSIKSLTKTNCLGVKRAKNIVCFWMSNSKFIGSQNHYSWETERDICLLEQSRGALKNKTQTGTRQKRLRKA